MKLRQLTLLAIASTIMLYGAYSRAEIIHTADFSNPAFYCEGKYQIYSVGDTDKVIGLIEGNVYSKVFVRNLRAALMPYYCLSDEEISQRECEFDGYCGDQHDKSLDE